MADQPVVTDSFDVPVEPVSLDTVQDRLALLWNHDTTVSATDRVRFEMAVAEIAANIIEHAFARDDTAGRLLHVTFTLDARTLHAVLSDNGVPTDLDLGTVTMPDENATSGRGLALVVEAVDELRYDHADGRNHWHLTCHRRDS